MGNAPSPGHGTKPLAGSARIARPGGGSRVETETRVVCTDDDARRQFSRYWWLIGRFSALIRRVMLGDIKRSAESQ